MITREIFSQLRIDRCARIFNSMVANWQRTGRFEYTVRLKCPSRKGTNIARLRKEYFSVGVGDDLTDVPFTDLLVIFSIIEQQAAAIDMMRASGRTVPVQLCIETEFTDDEAIRLLSGIAFTASNGRLFRLFEPAA